MSLDPKMWDGIFDIPPASQPVDKAQLVGLRLFTLEHTRADVHLKSTGMGEFRWKPGVNQATCNVQKGKYLHQPPVQTCTCGFYVGADVVRLHRLLGVVPAPFVLCGIQVWGKIVIHKWGFRAEYARIVTITDQLASRVLRGIDGKVISVQAKAGIEREIAEHLAKKYRLVLTDLAEMPRVLAKFGNFLPEEV